MTETSIERGTPFRNWSGLVRFTPRSAAQPRSIEQLCTLVKEAAQTSLRVRVRGSGHSFVPLVQTDDVLVDLDALTGIEAVEGHVASVWGGTKLHALGKELSARGMAMLNLGDINTQSIAGAVSTGTHGTGTKLGSISTQVEELTLVLADGTVRICSAQQHPELFAAARVSLGALGIIAKLRVRLAPSYRLKLQKRTEDLEACLGAANEIAEKRRHFEFYWFPHTRTVGMKEMDTTDEPESSRALHAAAELIIENGALGILSWLGRIQPKWTLSLSRFLAWSIKGDAGTMVADCHRAFSSPRLVRFHELEYALPRAHGADALRELAEYIDKKQVLIHFPVEYRYVQSDDIWLSPFYQRDSVAISVHQFVGLEYERYFAAAESIFRSYGGRPHWGKMHSLRARELATLYPRWDEFHTLRRALDPRGVFMNSYLDRLFGDET